MVSARAMMDFAVLTTSRASWEVEDLMEEAGFDGAVGERGASKSAKSPSIAMSRIGAARCRMATKMSFSPRAVEMRGDAVGGTEDSVARIEWFLGNKGDIASRTGELSGMMKQ